MKKFVTAIGLIAVLGVMVYLIWPKNHINKESLEPLHVYGNGTAGDFDNPAFRTKYPEQAWEGNDTTGYESAKDMALHMMTRDQAFDLYAIAYGSGGFHFLRDKGYCMPLTNEDIQTQVSRMHSFIKDAVTSEGQIYGVPIGVAITGLGYHAKNCEAVGITKDKLPRDYLAFFDIIDWWIAEGADKYPDYTLFEEIDDGRTFLLGTIVNAYIDYCQYTNTPLRFDTPVFRVLADRVDAIDTGLLNAQIKGVSSDMDYHPVSLFRVNQAYHDLESVKDRPNELPLMLSVVPGEPPRVAADLRLFIVNPTSTRKEAAIRYIDCFLQGLDQEKSILLFGGEHEPVTNELFLEEKEELESIYMEINESLESIPPHEYLDLMERKRLVEEQLERIDQNQWRISPETITAYQQFTDALFVRDQNILERNSTDGTLEIDSLIRRYSNKEITQEAFLNAADRLILFIETEDKGT